MNRKYRGYDGRALPWSRTGPGIRRIRRLIIKRAVMAGAVSAGLCSIHMISSAAAIDTEQRVSKALSVAQAVINTNLALININKSMP